MERATEVVVGFAETYRAEHAAVFSAKLGLAEPDEVRVAEFLEHLTAEGLADRTLVTGDVMTDVCLRVASEADSMNVIGSGATLAEAREQAYATLQGIELEGSHYRSDIALPAVEGRISI